MLYDKGYHTGSEFQIANQLGIDVLLAIPRVASNAPNPLYNVSQFIYDKTNDNYLCPEGKHLETNGNSYKAKTYNFKRYLTTACQTCAVKPACSKAKYGKAIQRSEYQELIENNKQRIAENEDYYKQRQAIVEHPYGTIKRKWGFSYIMTKKYIERAEADLGLMFTSYNLRRLINIIGLESLQSYLQELLSLLFCYILLLRQKMSHFKPLPYFLKKTQNFFCLSEKGLYLPKFNGMFVLSEKWEGLLDELPLANI